MNDFRAIPCPACEGSGEIIVRCGPHQCDTDGERCEACNGDGRVLAEVQPVEMDEPCHGESDSWCPSCGLGGAKP